MCVVCSGYESMLKLLSNQNFRLLPFLQATLKLLLVDAKVN